MSRRAEALEQAKHLWEVSGHLTLRQKLPLCKELAQLDVFSTGQVASIARMDVKTLKKRGIKSHAKGGRINPEAITALQMLEEQYRLNSDASSKLIQLCLDNGCTANAIADIVGVHHGMVYRRIA